MNHVVDESQINTQSHSTGLNPYVAQFGSVGH